MEKAENFFTTILAKSHVSKIFFLPQVAGRARAEARKPNLFSKYLSYLTGD
jgi:hypothetical protein